MNKTEYLLTLIAEEAVEVAQRATKALRFGLDEIQPGQELNNAQRIAQEFADLCTSIEMLDGVNWATHAALAPEAITAKMSKIRTYMQYSISCGTLTEE